LLDLTTPHRHLPLRDNKVMTLSARTWDTAQYAANARFVATLA